MDYRAGAVADRREHGHRQIYPGGDRICHPHGLTPAHDLSHRLLAS